VDVTTKGLTGKVSAETLDRARITVNKNTIPFDKNSPFVASGIRLGTPAITTRGMKEPEMRLIGEWIAEVLMNVENENVIQRVREKVGELVERFPLYPELREEIMSCK